MTRKILIVAQTTPLASTLVTWLGEVRHDPATLPWSVPDALLSGSRPFVLH